MEIPMLSENTTVTNNTTQVQEIIMPLVRTVTPKVQHKTNIPSSAPEVIQLAQVIGVKTVDSLNSTLNARISKRKQKINEILQKLKLRKLLTCNDKELDFAIRPLMQSYEMNYDIITKIFLPVRANTILCKTTKALENVGLSAAKDVIIDGIGELVQTISMNNNRLSILRIMIGIASTRAIIMYPQEHYKIRVFTNILIIKLPLAMSRNMEIKEKLTVLLAMKQLMKKLKLGHWKYSIKTQKRFFKNVYEQIQQVLQATEFSENSDSMSFVDEKSMEDEISTVFSEMDAGVIDFSTFSDILEQWQFKK